MITTPIIYLCVPMGDIDRVLLHCNSNPSLFTVWFTKAKLRTTCVHFVFIIQTVNRKYLDSEMNLMDDEAINAIVLKFVFCYII